MIKIRKLANESTDSYISRASLELYNQGHHIDEITSKLKCTPEAVYNAVMTPNNRMVSEEERRTIIKLIDSGYTPLEVSRVVGRSARCVRERYKTPAKRARGGNEYILTDKELTKLKTLYEDGYTLKYIAETLHITVSAVRWRLKKAGIYIPNKCLSAVLSTKDIRKVNSLHKKGYSIGEIASTIGKHHNIITKYLASK